LFLLVLAILRALDLALLASGRFGGVVARRVAVAVRARAHREAALAGGLAPVAVVSRGRSQPARSEAKTSATTTPPRRTDDDDLGS
jgi:hypothetical protein